VSQLQLLLVIVVIVAVAIGLGLVLVRPRSPGREPGVAVAEPTPHVREDPDAAGGFERGGLGAKVRALFASGRDDAWAGLEDLLLKADVGPKASAGLVARVRTGANDGADPAAALAEEVRRILGPNRPLRLPEDRLAVVVVVGVNGSGKTTTIGKLATSLVADGKTVALAGADTFRAAAGEQLDIWAARAGAHLVRQDRGADPSAVAFDAVSSALARGTDVLLIDTAGRLHTKRPLMDELQKLTRVVEKAGASVDEVLLVLDAQTGQNGIAQARAFTEAVDVTGVILTKTDGSAKGGIVLAVREELGLPIRLVGVGEAPGDLRAFDAGAFADRLVSG